MDFPIGTMILAAVAASLVLNYMVLRSVKKYFRKIILISKKLAEAKNKNIEQKNPEKTQPQPQLAIPLQQTKKRGRGRPRKYPKPEETSKQITVNDIERMLEKIVDKKISQLQQEEPTEEKQDEDWFTVIEKLANE